MKTLLVGWFWMAICSTASAEKLCNPLIKIQNATASTITVRWWCNGTRPTLLKGFELYYQTEYMQRAKSISLDFTKNEFTLTELQWRSKYQLFIEAIHYNAQASDRSETVEVELAKPVPCSPLLEIQQTTVHSITFKWACTKANPYPFIGYELFYYKKQGSFEGTLDSVGFERTQHQFTMEELSCGATFRFFIVVSRSKNYFPDASDEIEVTLGGPQVYPRKEDFLEIDEKSVTLKLDRWKSSCPVKIFNTILLLLPQYEVVDRSQRDPAAKRLALQGLAPNTDYELRVHIIGDYSGSWTSYTFKTLCNKQVPEAPSKKRILEMRHKYFVIHLEKWECVDSFAVEYRKEKSPSWQLVSNDSKAEQRSLLIQQLSLGTTYDIRINASNRFGATTAEYRMSQAEENDQAVCGDWTVYGTKCLKVWKEAGLLSKEDAQVVCRRFKDNMDCPSLLTVRNEDEHWFVTHQFSLPGPVWLGLRGDQEQGDRWDDGSQVAFSRWVKEPSREPSKQCAVMLREDEPAVGGRTSGKWMRTTCSAWHYVVCEKPQPRPAQDLIEELFSSTGQLEKRLTQAEKENGRLRQDLTTLVKLVASMSAAEQSNVAR